jgi:zinc protease
VVEVNLPNGLRALLIERHDLPFVVAHVLLRRRERPPIPGLETLLAEAILHAAPAGTASASEVITGLGGQRSFFVGSDAIQIEIKVAAPVFGDALRRLLAATAAPSLTQEGLDQVRKMETEEVRRRESRSPPSLRTRLLKAMDERLFPAGHRYADHREETVADLDKVTLADLRRAHRRAVSPATVAVCVAGDVTPAALREALAGAASWSSPPGKAAPRAQATLARGVFLVDDPGEERADVALVVPGTALDSPGRDAGPILIQQLDQAMTQWMRREVKTPWKERQVVTGLRAEAYLLRLSVQVSPGAVAPTVRGLLDVMARLGQGEIAADQIVEQRRLELRWQDGRFQSDDSAADILSGVVLFGAGADFWSRRYQATLTAGPEDVIRVAKAWLTRSEVRVVAVGRVAEAKPELEKLGLGPVTLSAAKPRAPADGAGKGGSPTRVEGGAP